MFVWKWLPAGCVFLKPFPEATYQTLHAINSSNLHAQIAVIWICVLSKKTAVFNPRKAASHTGVGMD